MKQVKTLGLQLLIIILTMRNLNFWMQKLKMSLSLQKLIKIKFLKKQEIITETQKIEKVEDLIQIVKIRENSRLL